MPGNIKPYLWGPVFWSTIYSFVATYPEKPDQKTIENARNFFLSLRTCLPCESCRNSYNVYILENDTNLNNYQNFSNRNNLIEFVYKLKNKVNGKTECDYGISLNYFKKKLNYMIAENSNNSAMVFNLDEVPFVPSKLEKKIYNYLKKKTNYKIDESKQIVSASKNFMENPNFTDSKDKLFKLFYKRNRSCREIIGKIYNNMTVGDYNLIDSFSKDNELHNKLFYLGCNIIPCNNLEKLLEKYN